MSSVAIFKPALTSVDYYVMIEKQIDSSNVNRVMLLYNNKHLIWSLQQRHKLLNESQACCSSLWGLPFHTLPMTQIINQTLINLSMMTKHFTAGCFTQAAGSFTLDRRRHFSSVIINSLRTQISVFLLMNFTFDYRARFMLVLLCDFLKRKTNTNVRVWAFTAAQTQFWYLAEQQ